MYRFATLTPFSAFCFTYFFSCGLPPNGLLCLPLFNIPFILFFPLDKDFLPNIAQSPNPSQVFDSNILSICPFLACSSPPHWEIDLLNAIQTDLHPDLAHREPLFMGLFFFPSPFH